MAIINSVSGNEMEITQFFMSCMDGLNSEADDAALIKIHMDYLKSFLDTFEQSELLPVLVRAEKVYRAQYNNRPIDIAATKIKHNDEFTKGERTEDIVRQELPTWPSNLSNPHRIQQLFGANALSGTGVKRKVLSATTNAKIQSKINNVNTLDDCLYLVEYFLKFFFIPQEKNYYLEYDALMTKLGEIGFCPKPRQQCFLIKDQQSIARDIVNLFLMGDLDDSDNKEFLMNCIDRYYQLYS